MQDHIVDIISKYLNRTASEDEKRQMTAWLEESEENRRFYSLFVANCSLHDTVSSPSLNENMEAMMARLDARISEAEQLRRNRHPKLAAFALSFAAVLLALFFVFRGNPANAPLQSQHAMELAGNTTSSTIHLTLEDGTHVYLAPGASIKYNVSTLKDVREVSLEGDAYFDVERNEARPFVVNTGSIGVRVLGTAFSVSSSSEGSQVVLERGSVRILSPDGNPMVSLSPNQKASYSNLTGDVRVEPVYATAFVTGKYNLVAMNDITVPEILDQLSKLYKVRLRCKGGAEDKRYNLAFLKSDSLEDVVSIVEYLTGAECEIFNNHK